MNENEQYDVYVCDSLYHIYTSYLFVITSKRESFLLLKDTIKNHKKLRTNLLKSKYFSGVEILEEKTKLNKIKKNLILRFFILNGFSKYFELLKNSENIFIFLDTTLFSHYIIKKIKNKKIHLIEDGEQVYASYHNKLKDIFKKIIGFPIGYGRDKEIKNIYVQQPERLNINIAHKGKKIELSNYISKLNKIDKLNIFEIFDLNINDFIGENICLLITQPLSEDNIISEKRKIEIYKEIIKNNINRNEKLLIKTHPREISNYKLYFPEHTIIDQRFPVEILNFSDIKFKKGITVFSSALNNLNNIENKVFFGIESFQDIEKGFKKIRNLEF